MSRRDRAEDSAQGAARWEPRRILAHGVASIGTAVVFLGQGCEEAVCHDFTGIRCEVDDTPYFCDSCGTVWVCELGEETRDTGGGSGLPVGPPNHLRSAGLYPSDYWHRAPFVTCDCLETDGVTPERDFEGWIDLSKEACAQDE